MVPTGESEVQAARRQLERVLASPGFSRNERLGRFLRFVVEQHLESRDGEIKESVIAIEVFGRRPDHDPKQDSIVRTEAARLRARLSEYYSGEGKNDALVIELPKGRYAPVFCEATVEPKLGPRPPLMRRRAMLLGGVAAATAASGFTAWKLWPSDSGIRSLAVLPFENPAKDDDAEFLCNGLTDSLIRQIAALPSLTVKRGGVFKGKNVDPQAAGRQLGVDAIVSGTVARRSGQLRITAELVDVRTGAVLWSGKYDRDEADLLPIQDQIASAILDEGIRLKLSEADRRRLVQHSTNNPEANELYLRALFYEAKETEGDYLTARKLLLEAIGKDKNFARAFGALARNYVIMAVDGYARPTEAWPLVKLYAEKALVLDPTLLEANAGLGAEAFWNQWNWSLAEQQYETALQSAADHSAMGYVLERWAVGRPDDALRLIRKVRVVDPLDLAWKLREADMLLRTAQTQSAAEIYEEIIRDSRDDPRAYFGLAEVRNTQKQFDQAITQLRLGYDALGAMDDSLLDVLAKARGAEGYRQAEKAGAQVELDGLAKNSASDSYVSPLDFSRAHARLGHKQQAFAYLDAAFADRAPGLVFLKVDHVWDSIRNEQRFQDAVKKVGLP